MPRLKLFRATLILLACGGLLPAQDTPPPEKVESPIHYYRLDFAVKDMQDGKVLDTRNYFVYISDRSKNGRPTSIRAGSKVGVSEGGGVNRYDLGVSIDCGYRAATKESLSLDIGVDISTMLPYADADLRYANMPILRQNRWGSEVVVGLRSPTTIFSSDDVASKRKLQIELTATPKPY